MVDDLQHANTVCIPGPQSITVAIQSWVPFIQLIQRDAFFRSHIIAVDP